MQKSLLIALFGLDTGCGGPHQRRLRIEIEWENFENRQVFYSFSIQTKKLVAREGWSVIIQIQVRRKKKFSDSGTGYL